MMRTVLALAVAAFAAPALADSARFQAQADNSIFLNVAAPTELSNGAGPDIFVGSTFVHIEMLQRGLVRFDISSLPVGATITSAKLHLTCLRGGPTGPTPVSVYRASSAWGEGTSATFGGTGAVATANDATWTSRLFPSAAWSTPGGDFAPDASAFADVPDAETEIIFSGPGLLTDVQAWAEGSAPNFGWLLKGDESLRGSSRAFASRENPRDDVRPWLELEYSLGGGCDPDANQDGNADQGDVDYLINVVAGGDNPTNFDADFNRDGNVDQGDIDALINVVAGGSCP